MAESRSLRQVNHTRLSDQAYEVLRDSILRRQLPPGHRLDLDDLQLQLGISRTPLKEAIGRLATEGLITIVPRRGSYVTELTAQDVAERFDVRQILELGAADDIITNMTDEHLAHLRQVYADLKALTTPEELTSDYFGFLDTDRDFHRAILRIAGNKLLLEIYDGLNLYLQIAKAFYLAQDKRTNLVGYEHSEILKALENRDAEELKMALRKHIQSAKQAVVSEIESQYGVGESSSVDQVLAGVEDRYR
ncbi:MAG: GntR family transcriptional regulator [Anaerolineae bacterium]